MKPTTSSRGEVARFRRLLRPLVVIGTLLAILIVLLVAFSNSKVLLELQADRIEDAVSRGRFDDYVAFYAAGALVLEGRGGELYDTDVITAKEQEVMGRPVGGTGSLGFFNPPFVAVVFAPLSLLPVGIAGVVLFAINVVLVLGVTVAVRRLLNLQGAVPGVLAAIAAVSLNSVFWLMGHGQLSMLLVIGFLGFFWFQRQGKPLQSGLALALLLVKPQMAILPILVLLWRRDWQALASFSSVAAALVVVSVAVSGPSVLWEYPSFALSSTGWDMEYGINVERMYGWNGLFAILLPNHSLPHLALTTVATLVTVGLVLRAFSNAAPASSQFALGFGAMVAGAMLINPHIYLQDMVLMVLVLVAGYLGSRELGWPASAWVGVAALVWVAQEATDRIFNAVSLNAPSLLLIGLLLVLVWTSVVAARKDLAPATDRLPQPAAA